MEEQKKEKSKKVLVEKDFLMALSKAVEDLKEKFNEFEQGGLKVNTPPANGSEVNTPPDNISPQTEDHIFQCMKIISKIPKSMEEIVNLKQLDKEFEAELQLLMKKYKVVQLTAMFLKRL